MKDGRSHVLNVSYLRHVSQGLRGLAFGKSGCGGSEFEGLVRAAIVDPDFGGDGLQGETDPEGCAEEFRGLRFVAAHQGSREESSHDWADCGDSKSDGVAANHPFAMPSELAAECVPKRFG